MAEIKVSQAFFDWVRQSRDLFNFKSDEEVLLFYMNRYMGKIKMKESSAMDIPFDVIYKVTANYYNVNINDITSMRGITIKALREPSYAARYLSIKLKNCSNSKLANYLKKDHSTISHSITKFEEWMEKDPEVKRRISELTAQITTAISSIGDTNE